MKSSIDKDVLLKYIKFLKTNNSNATIGNCFQRYTKEQPLDCDKCPFESLGFECINKPYIFKSIFKKFPTLLLEEEE